MAVRRFPLPPFLPAGRVIKEGVWDDPGEWDDSAIMFPGYPLETETALTTQTGAALETQDGQILII